jgi:hypothetical protein
VAVAFWERMSCCNEFWVASNASPLGPYPALSEDCLTGLCSCFAYAPYTQINYPAEMRYPLGHWFCSVLFGDPPYDKTFKQLKWDNTYDIRFRNLRQ